MKKYNSILILGNLLLLLAYFNWSVFEKEQTLKQGELVLFRLAPVDPRSLMQGDYMALEYEVADPGLLYSTDNPLPSQGYAILSLDSNHVAKIIRLSTDPQERELLIKYRKGRYSRLKLGAESFLFEEGSGELYQKAVYGGLRIDKNGNSILTGLYDSNFQLITSHK